jgi:hypothetical protein
MRFVSPVVIKKLWDEFRVSRQTRSGWWWLIEELNPPAWFLENELGIKS